LQGVVAVAACHMKPRRPGAKAQSDGCLGVIAFQEQVTVRRGVFRQVEKALVEGQTEEG